MRNVNTVWSKLFTFTKGQKVRIVYVLPCKKKATRPSLITQCAFELDLRGIEGEVVETNIPATSPYKYLIEIKGSFFIESSASLRTRIWCASEELELIT